LLEFDLLQAIEVAPDVAPFGGGAVLGEAVFEFLGEHEGKKGAEDAAADRHVAAVIDRAGGEHGFDLADQQSDAQQVAIAQHRP
jgi:hypothetical protein